LIFLTVGNWHKGYNRLVKAVDDLKGRGIIADEIVAQIGRCSYCPNNLKAIAFCSPSKFVENIDRARLIISHAGVGTMARVIKQGKPIIVVPRKASLGEISNDHQFATAKQLESESKVLVAYEVSELPDKLQQAKSFVPAKGQGGQKIVRTIEVFLEELQAKKCNGTNNE